ncbi:glycoside hydrolase superfamily [Kockovaella imperatae]|uniref:glucan endo-1,3-beta-D-glucosidase n=1 Tax=Kockovaella imperatae TaxID=4999 RepID=A0A1Y1UGD4_9TREE|nr:glycoside hydrolase superfamily [Kockovaella imperatae]ORX37088.1 glycoside hydrolase superfamily [Kockovaella imperatae]
MPVQQRYTPVPGMGRSDSQGYFGGSMSQSGSQGVTMGNGSGYGNHDPFETPVNSLSGQYPTSPTHNGPLPASSRGPRDDSVPQYDPSLPTNSYRGGPPSPTSRMRNSPTTNTFAYENVPSDQYWKEGNVAPVAGYSTDVTPLRKNNRWWKWAIGALFAAIIVGVVVGVAITQIDKSHKSGQGSSADDSSSSSSSGNATSPNMNDPSNFQKDSRLHQSFWGFAYSPIGTQPPYCGATLANVTEDIQLLSQLTTRLRLYGANCNTTALVLQAIQDTKVNMTIWPAIYVDSNETAYEAQVQAISSALTTYGVANVEGVTVGNEYILDTAGSNSNTSAAYDAAVETILSKVTEVKGVLQGLNLGKTLPVGTSDAGSLMSTTLGAGIDYFMANVHPWFGSVPIDQAAAWTGEFFDNFDVSVADISSGTPESYIAETGWPTASMDAKDANDGAGGTAGEASVANLQIFLDTFVCAANQNGTKYFYFEAFDEEWKAAVYGGVEPYWGIFDQYRNLKDITIPVCPQ